MALQCEAVELVLKSITVEEVNAVAAEICEHLTLYGEPGCAPPSACVATCPAYVKERSTDDLVPFKISERDMLRVREGGGQREARGGGGEGGGEEEG